MKPIKTVVGEIVAAREMLRKYRFTPSFDERIELLKRDGNLDEILCCLHKALTLLGMNPDTDIA